MAERCANEAIAKKFEALARDYEEHARNLGKGQLIVELGATGDAKTRPLSATSDARTPSRRQA